MVSQPVDLPTLRLGLLPWLGLALLAGCRSEPEAAAPAGPETVAGARAEFANWLEHAPSSPFRALVQHPLADQVTLGPEGSDVPLPGLGSARLAETSGRLRLTLDGAERPLGRDRLTAAGPYQLLASGPPGRTVLTVFGPDAPRYHPPSYYPDLDRWRLEVALDRDGAGDEEHLLGPDGSEVEATGAGSVRLALDGDSLTLRVFRLRTPGSEEAELEIYFQDETNGHGTYPAGRFVSLVPSGDGGYRLDFNRARNPFCAYSAVYPCPAPWRGNRIAAPVEAGERYDGGDPDSPPS